MRIFGIDPGSRVTGYGIIDTQGNKSIYVGSGVIATKEKEFHKRLHVIFKEIETLMAQNQPDVVAIENVFMHRNADSALKLGQAKAAAICGTFKSGLTVYEYAARQVKQAVVGKGSAEKEQVQYMVKIILGIKNRELRLDESDALAIAICHAHSYEMEKKMKPLGR
jgi:crossover junction endodeoxyribonuclease RuvC